MPYIRKYYLHRKIKQAGFSLKLEEPYKTILVTLRHSDAKTNKYLIELQIIHNYGVQYLNPLFHDATVSESH